MEFSAGYGAVGYDDLAAVDFVDDVFVNSSLGFYISFRLNITILRIKESLPNHNIIIQLRTPFLNLLLEHNHTGVSSDLQLSVRRLIAMIPSLKRKLHNSKDSQHLHVGIIGVDEVL